MDAPLDSDSHRTDYFHNIKAFLKKYRTLRENIARQKSFIEKWFSQTYGCDLESFVTAAQQVGIRPADDTSYVTYLYYAISYQQHRLDLVDAAMQSIRDNHPDGKIIYAVLYVQYIDPKTQNLRFIKRKEATVKLCNKKDLSKATYYRLLDEGERLLGELLWPMQDELEPYHVPKSNYNHNSNL